MIFQYCFRIADITFIIHIDHELIITENFRPFITSKMECDKIDIFVQGMNELPSVQGNRVFDNLLFGVWEKNDDFLRIYHDHMNDDMPYAVTKILKKNLEEIYYLKNQKDFFSESHNTFSHTALEELFINHDAMMLHSAFVKTMHGGVLFTGKSGVGKSTQAELWKTYRNAEIINGDRTIIRKKNSEWLGYGSPYAGSSRYFINQSCKINAVVLLEQGSTCQLKKLSWGEAFRELYRHMIVNVWNSQYIQQLTDLLSVFISETEIYQYICTADEVAVEFLEDALEGTYECR